MWNKEESTLHVLPHWNWEGHEGENIPVFVYTSYPEAELFINGVSYGRKRKYRAWNGAPASPVPVDSTAVSKYKDFRLSEPIESNLQSPGEASDGAVTEDLTRVV